MVDGIEYSRVTPTHFEDVITHLRYNFFADEPLNKSLCLSNPGDEIPELEELSVDILSQGKSAMATVGPNKEVVGAALFGVSTSSLCLPREFRNPKLAKIFTFIDDMAKSCEYGDDIEEKDIIHFKMMSVDSKMRGKRIASRLYEIGEQFCRESRYKLIRAEATALYSQKLLTSYGWQTLKEVKYSEYPCSEAPLFPVDQPNLSFKIMTKRIH